MNAQLQVTFAPTAIERARADIRDRIERGTEAVMTGRMTEAEYKLKAGEVAGLLAALAALDDAEKDIAKER